MRFYLVLVMMITPWAMGQSIFERLELDKSVISYQQLKTIVQEHSKAPDINYLSLGETHTQNATAHPIFVDLIKSYYSSAPLTQALKFCLEKIPAFMNRDDFKTLSQSFGELEISLKNSPYRTDFRDCYRPARYKKYITYSGFYHQFNYATTFPWELNNSSLARVKNNFINLQMPQDRGLFINQLNLYLLEVAASNRLLSKTLPTAKAFKKRFKSISQARQKLISSFEPLLTGKDQFHSKFGSVVKTKDITGSEMPRQSFMMLTELEYRLVKDYSFPMLKALAKRPDHQIKAFLSMYQSNATYFPWSQSGMDPSYEGQELRVCYGADPTFCFPYHAQFIEVKFAKHFKLFVAVGDELACYRRRSGRYEDSQGRERSYPFIRQSCDSQIGQSDQSAKQDRHWVDHAPLLNAPVVDLPSTDGFSSWNGTNKADPQTKQQ